MDATDLPGVEMVIAATRPDLDLAREVVSRVVDPEIPVLTIAELGILRDVVIDDGEVVVTITPTYSGCPALRQIEDEIRSQLVEAGFDRVVGQEPPTPRRGAPTGSPPRRGPSWPRSGSPRPRSRRGAVPPLRSCGATRWFRGSARPRARRSWFASGVASPSTGSRSSERSWLRSSSTRCVWSR